MPQNSKEYYLKQLARCQALLKNELNPEMRAVLKRMAQEYQERADALDANK